MDWRDEGILLGLRRHGESSAIIEALTKSHGRHAGLVRGGGRKSRASMLQPGALLSLEWNARLADHLGTYKVELIRSHAATIMGGRERLAALNVISALLLRLLPERAPDPDLYDATLALIEALGEARADWPETYARWELDLLRTLGFGLDLRDCAATGSADELIYISPRSGHAVSRGAGAPYAERLLPLPQFLIGQGRATLPEVRLALQSTGWFLEHRARPAFELAELPAARIRLLRLLEEMEATGSPAGSPCGPSDHSAGQSPDLSPDQSPDQSYVVVA